MPEITKEKIELLKNLLEKQKSEISPKRRLEILQLDFRNTLKKHHDLSKMVGIFSSLKTMIPTADRGKIKGENLIKKLSKDLAQESLSVLTCYHIRTKKGGASNIPIVKLFNELKESQSQIIDFSECLATVVPNAIFIWNDSKVSTILHESRSFHNNIFGDNIISFNIIFSNYDSGCPSMKHINENIQICKNKKFDMCRSDTCQFTKEINPGNREPLIKSLKSILVVSKTYNDIVPVFKDYFDKYWLVKKN
jgi:hypothetical protein